MTRHEIAEKLRQLNRWRRGDDETLLMPDPAAIGHWIDAAADALEEQDKRAAELARVMTERDKYHGALIARHGGEPVAILAELDAERARVAELEAALRDACAKSDGKLTTSQVLAILDARAESAAPADPFPCRSDPLRKGTDYKAAPAKQGGAQ